MTLNWMDVSDLSFRTLLLLEEVQLSWLPKCNIPVKELAIALKANPEVEWYFRNKCPRLNEWLNKHLENVQVPVTDPERIRKAEITVMEHINDWIVYVVDPAVYDKQPFLNWDSRELTAMFDFTGKTVIDVGAGTGRLTFLAAEEAKTVFAVEPIANLRSYLQKKAQKKGFKNIYIVDGLIENIPFPDNFTDVVLGGHVFGGNCEKEYDEMYRVVKPDGKIVLCPGNNDMDNDIHDFLINKGFKWSRFGEPEDGMKRKYWKIID